MKRSLFIAVCSILVTFSSTFAGAKQLELATVEYPPYYGAKLENRGFITEIIIAAFKHSGHNVDVKFMPWKRAFEGAKAGKYPGIFTMWYRKDREEHFAFSDPLPPNEIGFMARADSGIQFEKYEDLKSYKIGVVRGYANPKGFEEAGLKTQEVSKDQLNISKLFRKRVDLVLIDKITAQHIINTEYADKKEQFAWLGSVQVDPQHVGFSKKTPDYDQHLAAFNAGLRAITEDGTLKKIMASHGF